MAYKTKKTVGGIFSKTKDKINSHLKTDVVYEIPCGGSDGNNCSKKYIGTTKQFLKNRIQNHQNDIKSKKSDKTALAQHCIELGHKPLFSDTRVLCVERNYKKRMLLEALHIQASSNTLNRKQDTDNLHESYRGLVVGFMNNQTRIN